MQTTVAPAEKARPDGMVIQAKYSGNVRDDIEIAECSVSQLVVKANDSDRVESS